MNQGRATERGRERDTGKKGKYLQAKSEYTVTRIGVVEEGMDMAALTAILFADKKAMIRNNNPANACTILEGCLVFGKICC